MSYLDDLFGLQDKVAVVVGGYGVLGSAMTRALGRAGANVAVLGPDGRQAGQLAAEIGVEAGVEAMGIAADASDRSAVERAAEAVKEQWGSPQILVHAAGINSDTPFLELDEAEWDRIHSVNLKSMVFCCQVFGHQMIQAAHGGSIINISSISSVRPLSRVPTYSATKAGVNSLTRYLACEWACHGIRVNAVAPGFFPAKQNRKILTDERVGDIMRHTPTGRFGLPEELAGVVVWLASSASSFVTGEIVVVDGGFSAMTI